ncbi:MAG: ligase [Frankiales bacterium]|nr:ligase [Frankiales bacterium]
MRPMLASTGTQPAGLDWAHEVKWDGMRIIADITDAQVRLFSRSGRDVTVGFPELRPIATMLPDVVLDGEVIVLRAGVPSFEALAERMHVTDSRQAAELAEAQPVSVMAFDVLRLYGVELLDRPWHARRASLDKLELPVDRWRLSPEYDDGAALLSATLEQGLEGVVSKRRESSYQPGRRSRDWIKTAHRRVQSCLVIGWRPEIGSADRIGALLLGVFDETRQLRFAGRVGSGIGGRVAAELQRSLADAGRRDPPVMDTLSRVDLAGSNWCEPIVVVDVRHVGWTEAGRLRQPVFRTVRSDLDPEEIRREP